MSGCNLNDTHLSALCGYLGEGGLSALTELNISSNPDLTTAALKHVQSATQPKGKQQLHYNVQNFQLVNCDEHVSVLTLQSYQQ